MKNTIFQHFNLFRPIVAIILLFIPLYPKFPLTAVSGTYVAIRLDDVVVALAIMLWFIYQIRNKFPVLKEKITGLFVAYFLAIISATITAILIHQTDPPNILLIHLLRRFEYISLFFITLQAIKSLTDLKYLFTSISLATFLVCLYGYGQKYYQLPVISTMNEEFSKGYLLTLTSWTRISSTFAGHYDLATFLSVILVIIGGVIIIYKQPLFAKLCLLGLWLVSFNLLTLTASRISIFAFWGGMTLTLILVRRKIWIIPVTLLVVFSIGNSIELKQRLLATLNTIGPLSLLTTARPTTTPIPTPIVAIPTTQPSKISPVPTAIVPLPTVIRHPTEDYPPIDADVGVARSGEIRFNVEWPRAITAFSKNFFVGTGLGSITLATDNDYLRLLGESGLFGFITFMIIIFWFIQKTFHTVFQKHLDKSRYLQLILLGALVTTLANAIFIDVFEASKTAYLFWIMMAVYYQAIQLTPQK